MSKVNIACPVPRCTYVTGEVSEIIAAALLSAHSTTHSARSPANHGPKLERPSVDVGVSAEEWKLFERRWNMYAAGCDIADRDASTQLFQCASPQLGDAILRTDNNVAEKSETDMLSIMKSLAIIPVATMVTRSELFALRQKRDETFRSFFTRVRGKAEICAYTVKSRCDCGKENTVDFTETIVHDVVVSGIYDEDIKRHIMSTKDLCEKSSNDIVSLVEAEEMARDSIPTTISISSSKATHPKQAKPSPHDPQRKTRCPHCENDFYPFKKGRFGWNKKPHTMCSECFRNRKSSDTNSLQVQSDNASIIMQMAAISHSDMSVKVNTIRDCKDHPKTRRPCSAAPIKLSHHIFTKGEWKKARFTDHPRVNLMMSVDRGHYTSFGVKSPNTADVMVACVADTGAQSNLWSLKHCQEMGFTQEDLIPVNSSMTAANKSRIAICGAILLKMSGNASDGTEITCSSMVYVSSSVTNFYLSYDTMMDLGIIPATFPSVGDAFVTARINAAEDFAVLAATSPVSVCRCPSRKPVPPRPTQLPFECNTANVDSMRNWLLDQFSMSTFNTCPHQHLPCMKGPPIEMHLDPDATPRVCHTAANVPLHWQEQVKADLERDVALGVIERVPYGEPVTWCHRMVVTRKHDGTPRRTVDLSPLNKFCKRETFAMESPFHLARKVPGHTWKTVTDAWNGYHSVPLRESDRHLTTFITPFGRFRYKRAPQGFVSSGDGYNRRFDAILSDFVRKERCVDDTIHYDMDLEQHWWRTIDFLRTVGEAGIVLNPSKFQFCQKAVEFAGFRLGESVIEPLPKYLDAIRDFPTPKNITDMRSWFGLVNQVANYAQLRDVMAPFRSSLSPKNPFQWTKELDAAFQRSKDVIVSAIVNGVEIFDLTRKTCLRPDWSRQGIGYFLLQKHCECSSELPDCCANGWRIVLAGSRFLLSAEQRYAAIEGEALAVAWGLEQSKYFTQGCEDLIVVTDHKPLVKILGDRTLDEITNTRLFRLKQRTLPWHFKIRHLPGRSNHAADATSRNPSPRINDYADQVSQSLRTTYDDIEVSHTMAISDDVSRTFTLTWSDLEQATSADATLNRLMYYIGHGFPPQRNELHDDVAPYWNFRDALYIAEGVIMYNDRVVVPTSLRHTVLTFLHSAHQGASMMELRARTIVFWPGMTQDIKQIRESCIQCCRNAPSQPAVPSSPAHIPSTPFECIATDYFESHGHQYLVVADRLSGWVEVFSSLSSSFKSTADGLVAHLRNFIKVFGTPEELSSDGGPQFTASVTQAFFARWGIRHRLSSAYYPQSNGRAEVAVKTAKRLLLDNIGPSGSLNNDKFVRAILQLRNTPDPDCNLSPAEIVFGRQLRDAFTFVNKVDKFSNPEIRPMWRDAWRSKESALRTRFTRNMEKLNTHARSLPPLLPGERVFVQNQVGSHPKKWDRSGVVMERNGNDQYLIKIDGSGRVTLRNRRFLRRFTPASHQISFRNPSPAAPRLLDEQPMYDELSDWRAFSPPELTRHGDQSVKLRDPLLLEPQEVIISEEPIPDVSEPLIHVPVDPAHPQSQKNDSPNSPGTDQPAPIFQRPRRERKRRKLYRADTGTWEIP